ncbi:carbon starvation protein A [Blastopirellula sp. J2-11]|uniref:carbon starvation CstA family protein n=1 Tax=Blastopirellula sp. J2-11 TaxID=2943192 RepID=UPI0021C84A18|nr:carbon starvation protein A [Blastopirellula sp. J2-11]UUO05660.1 carbon starvation protein A [Blastopirellula sp. J2-11]
MSTLIVAALSFFGFILAYNTYGRWLSRKIFRLDEEAVTPSHEMRDDVDFVPTNREVVFGHHFTSIAGTGPIVGPAIAVFWGWLPALLWVIFGSIFIGAVHDFGALVVSLRNRGQTIGEVAGRLINPRAKILFLLVLALALTVVLAIFGLVIALIFAKYPQSVLSVWVEVPVAIAIGYYICRKGGNILWPSLGALLVMYAAIAIGVYWLPIDLTEILGVNLLTPADMPADASWWQFYGNAVVIWTVILLVYCFVASVLPVWTLLQPRDYINSHELVLALFLLGLGLVVASLTGAADLFASAPAIATNIPLDAPPIFPFLFITIACGACSGFHCLVSSGTSSKQVDNEKDAQYVGYGAMLLEGALAVVVILACCAGVGMGRYERADDGSYHAVAAADGTAMVGRASWEARYDASAGWKKFNNLGNMVGAFVDGGANFLTAIGIPLRLGLGIMAVLVASFAATTLDTATRLQRYVLQELFASAEITKPLTNKYVSTGVAVGLGGLVAIFAGNSPGAGGMLLWPLFGAVNQLLAGIALMVTIFYLWRRKIPVWFAVPPMILMLVLPAIATFWNMFNGDTAWFIEKYPQLTWLGNFFHGDTGFYWNQKYLLFGFSVGTLILQAWMMVEAALMWPKAKGMLEEALPPLAGATDAEAQSAEYATAGGQN